MRGQNAGLSMWILQVERIRNICLCLSQTQALGRTTALQRCQEKPWPANSVPQTQGWAVARWTDALHHLTVISVYHRHKSKQFYQFGLMMSFSSELLKLSAKFCAAVLHSFEFEQDWNLSAMHTRRNGTVSKSSKPTTQTA